MKKFFLIPLMTLVCSVMAWAGDLTEIAVFNSNSYYYETDRTTNDATNRKYKSEGEAFKAAIDAANTALGGTVYVKHNVTITSALKSGSSTEYKAQSVSAGKSGTGTGKDFSITIDGEGNNYTLNVYFSALYQSDILTLKDVTIKPENATGTACVQLYKDSRLILKNAHLIGQAGKNAIKVYSSTEGDVCTIETATETTNSITNTADATPSSTLMGNKCKLIIAGNGTLTVSHKGTTGALFNGPTPSSGPTWANFQLDAPNATYTYENINCSEGPDATVVVTKNEGTYDLPISTITEGGKKVYQACGYSQIQYALNQIQDGETLRLVTNHIQQISKPIVITKSITVDFNGKTLYAYIPNLITIGENASSTNTVTFTGPAGFADPGGVKNTSYSKTYSLILVNSNLVINNGKFDGTGSKVATNTSHLLGLQPGANVIINDGKFISYQHGIGCVADASKATKLTINDGTFTGTYDATKAPASYIIRLDGNTTVEGDAYADTVTINGGTFSGAYSAINVFGKGAVLNVAGGNISGRTYGIAGNGTVDATTDLSGTKINISAGTIASTIEGGAAIYHPQNGTLKIKGNPVITGHTAIQMCAGTGMTASITGGRFEGTGADLSEGKSGDGAIGDGAALSMVARDGYAGAPNFTVSGGTFLSKQSTAIKAYMWADNTMSTWADRKNYLSITEGLFSHDPSEYVADGKKEDGITPMYKVEEIASPYTGYSKLYQVSLNVAELEMADNFTEAEAEYVRIGTSTTGTDDTSIDTETKTVTLEGDQNAKYIKVEENYNLVVDEDKTLNIGTGGLVLENNATLTIKPNAVVTVGTNGIINSNAEENLVLESNAEEQAVLLIDPDVVQNTKPQATVVLHTKARQKSANPWNYIWEYFAIPVTNMPASPANNGNEVELFEGDAFITGVYTWGGNDWTPVTSWSSVEPFKGYQLTNNSANGGVDYTFKGKLMGNDDGTYAFTAQGYGYFGNSYSAPIVISNFLSALDNTKYERTVWLYDAGADTYVSINPLAARIGSVKYKGSTEPIREIRSLQAFILNKKSNGEGSVVVNYRDAIWNNPRINSLVATANPAPARHEADEMLWTNIYVTANGNKELVTLVEGEDFSNAFDNGADAGKYINNNSMNLYAATNEGNLAIVATDNLENTLISFQAGNATEYTLSIENGNEDYMLRDNVTGMTVAMEEGAEYTFTQAANTTAQARFEVVAIAKMPTAIENVEEAVKATGIYTITGQYMGRDFTKLPAGVYVVNGVKIVK